MDVLYPPEKIVLEPGVKTLFLAGSIDMGRAEAWQDEFIRQMTDLEGVILNPRRPDWDSSWEQSADNPLFAEQVNWELTGLESAGLTAMYFAPDSQAPITLLELGLRARSGRILVCCPEGYWRKGNVDIICRRYGLPQIGDLKGLIRESRNFFS